MQRDLLAHVSHLGTQVLPVQSHQPLARDQAEPEENRHPGILPVLGGTLGHIQVRLLQDVGRVETPLEPPIHPELHHPPQPVPVSRKKFAKRSLVASLDAAESGLRSHRSRST